MSELKRLTDKLLAINPNFKQARKLGQALVDMAKTRRVAMWSGWAGNATADMASLEVHGF